MKCSFFSEALVEEDTGNEFSHLTDPDEFENFSDKSEVNNIPLSITYTMHYII